MQYIRRWRSMGGILAIIMVLSHVRTGQALGNTNMVNTNFGYSGQCTLNGWSYRGAVDTQFDDFGNCLARLTASIDLRTSVTNEIQSSIEQTFFVSSSGSYISFYYASALCGFTFSLHNTSGTLLYQERFTASGAPTASSSSLSYVQRDFSQFRGQQVKLSIKAHVASPPPGVYTQQKLLVDFQITNVPDRNGPDPELPGGGGL
jgi:hypothetical protein